MKENFVNWEDIAHLANVLEGMRDRFDEREKRALELVFEAAGDELTGRKEAQYLGTIWGGSDSRQNREAVKVNLLYVPEGDGGGNGPTEGGR
ncbi:hypothetical protein [Streptomyces sp. NPDC017991]|uniref:hypothetical protein n=1 Tax=Streptomyces sp. NPDC017991 TaxID=3365026 RepID=UPI00378CA515